jgi:hypothetical protein
MQEFDVKIALKNYHEFKKSIKRAQEKIEVIETRQTKTGGSVIKIPERTTSDEQFKLALIEKKFQQYDDIDLYGYYVGVAEHFIKSMPMPYRQMMIDKYMNRKSNTWLAQHYNYDPRQILRIVNKLIRLYVEQT